MATLTDLLNKVKKTIKDYTPLDEIASSVENYFNPTSNQGQNFWSTPVAQRLANLQLNTQPMVQPILNTLREGGEAFARAGVYTNPLNPIFNRKEWEKTAPKKGDIGKMTRGLLTAYGLTKPTTVLGGGLFSAGFNTLANLVTKKPITQNLPESIGEGAQFGALVSPLGEAAALLPVRGLANLTSKPVLQRILPEVAKEFATGAGYGAATEQNPIKTGLEFAPFGLTGTMVGKTGVKAMADFKNPVHPEDKEEILKAIDILTSKDPKVFIEKAAEAGKTLRLLASHYIDARFGKKAPIRDVMEELLNRLNYDYGYDFTLGFVEKTAPRVGETLTAKILKTGKELTGTVKKIARMPTGAVMAQLETAAGKTRWIPVSKYAEWYKPVEKAVEQVAGKVKPEISKENLMQDIRNTIMDNLGSNYSKDQLQMVQMIDQGYSKSQIKQYFKEKPESWIDNSYKNIKDDWNNLQKIVKQKGLNSVSELIFKTRKEIGQVENRYIQAIQEISQPKTEVKPEIPKERGIKEKPEIKTIPPELEPLAQEARKYKSAEEFVKNYSKIFDDLMEKGIIGRGAKYDSYEVGQSLIKQFGGGKKGLIDFYAQAIKGIPEVKPAEQVVEKVKTTIPPEPEPLDKIVNDFLTNRKSGTELTKILKSKASETKFLPREQKASITLYHGGSINDLNSVLERGLDTSKVQWATGSRRNVISLTPDFSLAERFGKAGHLNRQLAMPESGKPAVIYKMKIPIEDLFPDTHQINNARLWKKVDAKNTLGDSLIHGNAVVVKNKIYPTEIESVFIWDSKIGDYKEIPFTKQAIQDFYNQATSGTGQRRLAKQALEQIQAGGEVTSRSQLPSQELPSPKSEQLTQSQTSPLPKEPVGIAENKTLPSQPIIPEGFKERGVMRTIRTSEATPPELTKEIEKITGSTRFYRPYSDIASLKEAKSRIAAEGVDNVKKAVLEGEYSKGNVAAGEILVSKALNEGRIDEATEIIKNLSLKATQAGQANQAWAMWSRITPAGFLKYAESEVSKAAEKMGSFTKSIRGVFGKKSPELTTEDKKIITDYMIKANQAATEEEKAKFVKLAMQTVADKIPLGVSDIFDAYRYNNMLSGLPTHERNFFNNVWNTFITPALTMAAEGRPKQAVLYEFNAIKNIPKGLDAFVKSLKRETPIDLSKIDLSMDKVKYEKLPRPLTIFSDLMEASDKLFSGIIESSMTAIGKTPEEATKLAEEYLVRKPLNERGYGILSDGIRVMGEGIDAFGKKFKPMRWAVPFLRTPFDAAVMQLEYSPMGAINLMGSQNKRTAIARALLGSTATFWGATLALQGRTTWAVPTDPEEKKWFYATGRKPFSVKIGDKWVPAYYFGPFVFAILLPAAANYYYNEAPDALSAGDWEKLGKTISSAIYYWSQSSPLAGLGGFVRTLEGDVDYSFAKNLAFNASQLIPYSSMLRYIANIFDPVYRKPQGFVEQLKTNIPFLSQTIQQTYQEPTGEPAKRDITNYILPWAIGTETPERQVYEPFYRERQQERQQTRLINTLKKQIEEGQPVGGEAVAMLYGKRAEKTGEPLSVLVERAKLQAQYKKANDLFDLYLRAPDDATRAKIEQSVIRMGIDPAEGLYNYLTTQETAPKTEYIKAIIAQNPNTDIVELLSPYRKEGIASGKPLLSDGVIDNLYDEGLITAEQKKYLKSLKWDTKQKKVVGKKGTGKKIKISEPPTIKIKQVKPAKIKTTSLKVKTARPRKVAALKIAKPKAQTVSIRIPKQTYQPVPIRFGRA
jgi:hypothetical protein